MAQVTDGLTNLRPASETDRRSVFVPNLPSSNMPIETRTSAVPKSAHGPALAILLTGLPGAGKTSIARELASRMEAIGHRVTILDADELRSCISPDLGFSGPDREANLRRAGLIAAEVAKHGGTVICSFVSAHEHSRQELCEAVQQYGTFLLMYISTPLEECERRDPNGLYRKARAGLLGGFPGISDIYEVPEHCDSVVDTTGLTVADATDRVIRGLAVKTLTPDLWLLAGLRAVRPAASAAQCDIEKRRARLFQRVLQVMPTNRIRLGTLARQLGVERHTIEKAVRSITGRTFRQLQQVILLQRAGLLLKQGRTVKETAFDLGFGSPQAFDRFVKRTSGETPSSLRQPI